MLHMVQRQELGLFSPSRTEDQMAESIQETPPRVKARIAGLFYLLTLEAVTKLYVDPAIVGATSDLPTRSPRMLNTL
jgi:hypothetical protein